MDGSSYNNQKSSVRRELYCQYFINWYVHQFAKTTNVGLRFQDKSMGYRILPVHYVHFEHEVYKEDVASCKQCRIRYLCHSYPLTWCLSSFQAANINVANDTFKHLVSYWQLLISINLLHSSPSNTSFPLSSFHMRYRVCFRPSKHEYAIILHILMRSMTAPSRKPSAMFDWQM